MKSEQGEEIEQEDLVPVSQVVVVVQEQEVRDPNKFYCEAAGCGKGYYRPADLNRHQRKGGLACRELAPPDSTTQARALNGGDAGSGADAGSVPDASAALASKNF